MKNIFSSLLLVLLTSLASLSIAHADECYEPAAPIIPDGNVASEDELVAAQKAIKIYQTSLIDYRTCLDEAGAGLDPENEDDQKVAADLSSRYNASVAAETQVADEFNVAVRAFKARQ